ncbi:hypothetical protein ACR782_20600 [Sphingobacterium spiritivorum]|uniref:hypothetical protein n=1 Tax=Sphingobacterium spiritivorum TaxID=258 RepID=UPI003DA6844E
MNTTHERKANQNYPQAPLRPVTRETQTENHCHRVISSDTTTCANTTPINKVKKDAKNYTAPKITTIRIEMENGIAAGSATAIPASTNKPVDETWDNQNMTSDSPIYW